MFALIFEEAQNLLDGWRLGWSAFGQRAEQFDFLFGHLLSQGALDESSNHLGDELKKHQCLDAGILLQPDRRNIERGFEQRMALLDPGLVLVDIEYVDRLLLGVRCQREDPIHRCRSRNVFRIGADV